MSMKPATFSVAAPLMVGILLTTAPAQAQNLEITIDQLIERVGAASDAAGETLSFEEQRCVENPKPGDKTQTVISCLHRLGDGRTLITNAEPEGPLLNISTRPWDAGEGSSGAFMISWIASAINGSEPAAWRDSAEGLVDMAAAEGVGSATMGSVDFTVLDSDGKLTIGATPNSAAATQ